ncbi:hypothetical protein SPH72_15755 [Rhodobacterales bacterium FZCC0083]|nr:hypothetical protein SPH72_15755 [Rhodobacterales bacterium FZCC0083]
MPLDEPSTCAIGLTLLWFYQAKFGLIFPMGVIDHAKLSKFAQFAPHLKTPGASLTGRAILKNELLFFHPMPLIFDCEIRNLHQDSPERFKRLVRGKNQCG